ncbi:MAG: hypothetical protein HYY17_10445 [Planctomycetes bacterium]|nr:hypothetical protein [Planctomycetota bacterium]
MRYLLRGADVEAEAALTDDAIELRPKQGQPLVVPYRDIDAAASAEYRIRLTLFPPGMLELYYLGPRFEGFCEEFFEKRNAALVRELFLADRTRIATFKGRFAREGSPPMDGRIDLFPRTIVFFPKAADPFFLRVAEIQGVRPDRENDLVEIRANETVTASYLGLRFEEFQERLMRTRSAMERRCARMLDALVPGAGVLAPRLLDGNVMQETCAAKFREPIEALVCRTAERDAAFRHLRSLAKRPLWLGIQETGGGDLDDVEGPLPPLEAHRIWYYVPLGGVVAQEIVSEEDHATYFYRAEIPEINRMWALLQFRKDVILDPGKYPAAVRKLPHLREVTEAFAGRAVHDRSWEKRVAGFVS